MKKQSLQLNKFASYFRKPYYRYLRGLVLSLVPKQASVIEFDYRKINNDNKKHSLQTFDYILITNAFSYTKDVQQFIQNTIVPLCHNETRIVVISFNFFWKPLLDLASFLKLRKKDMFEPNWLSVDDISNMFKLEKFDLVKQMSGLLFPFEIPIVSSFINTYLSPLPILSSLGLVQTLIFRKIPDTKNYSVSVIVPARNEEGNIPNLLNRIPMLGTQMEVLFIEGHSRDKTYDAIKTEINRYSGPIRAYAFKQSGIGKKDAVELGFRKAKNELIIILDADLTVDPSELSKFYDALAHGYGELIIGSRLVYPMEKQAMRTLNIFGNKFFSIAFSFLLGQKIKDTLCGTKALLSETYKHIVRAKKLWGNVDPYGDFDLIFGASKLNLKIVEIPIRYKERTYGTSNISRFKHGLLLLKMTLTAASKLKFINYESR